MGNLQSHWSTETVHLLFGEDKKCCPFTAWKFLFGMNTNLSSQSMMSGVKLPFQAGEPDITCVGYTIA
jgi:hypothetical protein